MSLPVVVDDDIPGVLSYINSLPEVDIMDSQGWLIPVVVGVVFVLLGLGAVIWGKREEKKYYDALVTRKDLREFFDRWPFRPEPGALKVGGWIAVVVGLVIAIIGGIFGARA
jgi:hypothetical protein